METNVTKLMNRLNDGIPNSPGMALVTDANATMREAALMIWRLDAALTAQQLLLRESCAEKSVIMKRWKFYLMLASYGLLSGASWAALRFLWS